MTDSDNVVELPKETIRSGDLGLAAQLEAIRRAMNDFDEAVELLDSRIGGEPDTESYYMSLVLILKGKLEQLHYRLLVNGWESD